MKKFLLSAACVMMTLAASAQVVSISDLSKAAQKAPVKANFMKDMKCEKFNLSNLATAMKKAPRKAEDVSSLYGDYIWYDAISNQDGVDQTCDVTISKAEDYTYTDEETGQTYTYPQVYMEGLAEGYADVYAIVDADTLIVYGGQYCYSYGEYGNMSLCGLVLGTDPDTGDEALYFTSSISFVKDEDGNFALYPGYVGWVIYMDDYSESLGETKVWNSYYDMDNEGEGCGEILKANGLQAYYSTTSGSWAQETANAYVKKSLNQIKIYNFVGLSVASMTLSSDGVASLPMGQPMYDISAYDADEAYGTSMDLRAVSLQDGLLYYDFDAEDIKGEWGGNTSVTFNGTGEDDDVSNYFVIVSQTDADGRAYRIGYYTAYQLIFNEDYENYLSGINTVNVSNNSNTGKSFNILGQQVKANTKGIVIRDGKKYLNK